MSIKCIDGYMWQIFFIQVTAVIHREKNSEKIPITIFKIFPGQITLKTVD